MFNPTSVSGCFLWFESTSITGLVNGGLISSTWPDLSGSGNNLTPVLNPQYLSNVINGYPVIAFSGGNYFDSLVHNASLELSNNGLSIYSVYRTLDPYTQQPVYCSEGAGGATLDIDFAIGVGFMGLDGKWFYSWGQFPPSLSYADASTPTSGEFLVRSDHFTSSGLFFGVNGSDVASVSAAVDNHGSVTTFKVGYSHTLGEAFNGQLAEIIGYNNQLNTTNHNAVNTYLYDKYFTTPPPISWTPDSISGCLLWIDGSSVSGNPLSGSGITAWLDMSGSGNNIQATGTLPIYMTSILNGWPVVNISGSPMNTILSNPSLQISGVSIYSVYSTNDEKSNQCLVSLTSPGTTSVSFNIGINSSGIPSGWYYSWSVLPPQSITAYSGGSFNYSFQTPTGVFLLRSDRCGYDNTLEFGRLAQHDIQATGLASVPYGILSGTTSPFLTLGGLYFAKSNSNLFNGSVAEVIIYNNKLNDFQDGQVVNYLLSKYFSLTDYGTFSLYMSGYTNPNNIPLYIGSTQKASGSFTEYVYGKQMIKNINPVPLYIGNVSTGTAPKTLFMWGKMIASGNRTLVVSGAYLNTHNVPLYTAAQYAQAQLAAGEFIHGKSSGNLSTTLFIDAAPYQTQTIPLFTFSKTSSMDNMYLYIRGLANPALTGSTTLFMTTPSVTGAGVHSLYRSMDLFVNAGSQVGAMNLFIKQGGTAGLPSQEMPLYMQGPITTGHKSWVSILFIQQGNKLDQSFMKPLYIRGLGSLAGGLIMTGSMPLYIDIKPNQYTPLYIHGKSTASGSFPMTVSGVYKQMGNTTLYVGGTAFSGLKSLYISGPGSGLKTMTMTISGKPFIQYPAIAYTRGF